MYEVDVEFFWTVGLLWSFLHPHEYGDLRAVDRQRRAFKVRDAEPFFTCDKLQAVIQAVRKHSQSGFGGTFSVKH